MTPWNVKLATKICSRAKVVTVGTCKNKTVLSTIWEEGLFNPAYSGGFYQPSDAVGLPLKVSHYRITPTAQSHKKWLMVDARLPDVRPSDVAACESAKRRPVRGA